MTPRTTLTLCLATLGAFACSDGGQRGTRATATTEIPDTQGGQEVQETQTASETLCHDTGGTWASATCTCPSDRAWDPATGCTESTVPGPLAVLCASTLGTWHADTATCTCPAESGWTNADGCASCTKACASQCPVDDGEACGADHAWWCPCELACMGVAKLPRIECCPPVPSNCVATCEGGRAGNCQSGTNMRGCPALEWTWETCGGNELCVADPASDHAACVPVCDPPATCHAGCDQGAAVTCRGSTGENGCASVTVDTIPCGGMTCAVDATTGAPRCQDPCAADDVSFGTAACDRAWGYRWDGASCSYVGGFCPCTGRDCESLALSEADCLATHAVCMAATTDKARCDASSGMWSGGAGGHCECGDGGAWDAQLGCWPARHILCTDTGGTFAPAFCGPFCGECTCQAGTHWDDALGCRAL